jgi:hypothetical protein
MRIRVPDRLSAREVDRRRGGRVDNDAAGSGTMRKTRARPIRKRYGREIKRYFNRRPRRKPYVNIMRLRAPGTGFVSENRLWFYRWRIKAPTISSTCRIQLFVVTRTPKSGRRSTADDIVSIRFFRRTVWSLSIDPPPRFLRGRLCFYVRGLWLSPLR